MVVDLIGRFFIVLSKYTYDIIYKYFYLCVRSVISIVQMWRFITLYPVFPRQSTSRSFTGIDTIFPIKIIAHQTSQVMWASYFSSAIIELSLKPMSITLRANSQQFHARSDLLILESGSDAVFLDVSFFFIPLILAQNDALLGFPTFLLGALRSDPGFSLS